MISRKAIAIPKQTLLRIDRVLPNENILTTIRDLFNACGAQSFSEILHEVREQCPLDGGLEKAHLTVEASLAYLIAMGAVVERYDEYGFVYGHPSDLRQRDRLTRTKAEAS